MFFYVSKNPKDNSKWLKVTCDSSRADNVVDSLASVKSWEDIHQLVVEEGKRKSVVPLRHDGSGQYFEYDGFRYNLKDYLTEDPGFLIDRFSKSNMSFNEFLKILDRYGTDKFTFTFPAWSLDMFGIRYENGKYPYILRSDSDGSNDASEFTSVDSEMAVNYCNMVCRLKVPKHESVLFADEFVFEPLFLVDPKTYTFVSTLYEPLPLFKLSRVDLAVTLGHTIEIFEYIIELDVRDIYTTYLAPNTDYIFNLNDKFKAWFDEFIKSDDAMDVGFTPISEYTSGMSFDDALASGLIRLYDKTNNSVYHRYGGNISGQPLHLEDKIARF